MKSIAAPQNSAKLLLDGNRQQELLLSPAKPTVNQLVGLFADEIHDLGKKYNEVLRSGKGNFWQNDLDSIFQAAEATYDHYYNNQAREPSRQDFMNQIIGLFQQKNIPIDHKVALFEDGLLLDTKETEMGEIDFGVLQWPKSTIAKEQIQAKKKGSLHKLILQHEFYLFKKLYPTTLEENNIDLTFKMRRKNTRFSSNSKKLFEGYKQYIEEMFKKGVFKRESMSEERLRTLSGYCWNKNIGISGWHAFFELSARVGSHHHISPYVVNYARECVQQSRKQLRHLVEPEIVNHLYINELENWISFLDQKYSIHVRPKESYCSKLYSYIRKIVYTGESDREAIKKRLHYMKEDGSAYRQTQSISQIHKQMSFNDMYPQFDNETLVKSKPKVSYYEAVNKALQQHPQHYEQKVLHKIFELYNYYHRWIHPRAEKAASLHTAPKTQEYQILFDSYVSKLKKKYHQEHDKKASEHRSKHHNTPMQPLTLTDAPLTINTEMLLFLAGRIKD